MPVPFVSSRWIEKCTLLSAVSLLLLSGCASLAPPHATPALPVPSSFAETPINQDPAGIGADPAASAAHVAWRDYFTDSHLQQLIEQALEHNRDLRAAILRVEEARAAYGIQYAERVPTLGLGASGERARLPGDLSPSGSAQTGSQYQLGIGLNTWELDFWGRVRNLNEAALETYLATDEARRAAQLSLITRVANSYYQLRELDERLLLARQTIASREESLRIFSRRVEVGAAAPLELTQVEVLLHQAKTLGAQLEQARTRQANALALVVGTPFTWEEPQRLANSDTPNPLPPGLPSDLLLNRPDILAAEHALRAANANIGAARAAFFPRIALTGSLGTASADLNGLFGSDSHAWSFSPTLSLPIFDGGRRGASLELAEVRREQAVVDYERTIQAAFRDVADALAAEQWLLEEERTAHAMLGAQRERARLAQLRFEHGAVPYLEVLDAQRDLLTAEQQIVQTRRELLSARIGLYAALGGGSRHLSSVADTHTLADCHKGFSSCLPRSRN